MDSPNAHRKVVLPGGSGHLGRILCRHFAGRGDDVVVLSRGSGSVPGARVVAWDGRRLDDTWARELDGADLVVNLAGRSVDCRYHKTNLEAMYASRIDSTRAVGEAVARAERPPPVWLQMSTATIYAHTHDRTHDEHDGEIGGHEPGVPSYWRTSVRIAECWERELRDADTPDTRRVALRTAMVMSTASGGAFEIMERLTRFGLGGAIAGGRMSMSWIHERDFVRAIEHIASTPSIEGPCNLAAPEPIEQRAFMAAIRAHQRGVRAPVALPAARWMIHVGSVLLRTDPELVLKSRRVVSSTLDETGFDFEFRDWASAAADLAGA